MSRPRHATTTWMMWGQLLTCAKLMRHQSTSAPHSAGSQKGWANSSLAPAINLFFNMLAKPKVSCLYCCCLWEGSRVSRGVTNTPAPAWAAPALLCLISEIWNTANMECLAQKGLSTMSVALSDNIYTHSYIHMYICGLTLPLNFIEAQVLSVSNLLNKLFQNCQVGYFSPLSLNQNYLGGRVNYTENCLSFYIWLRERSWNFHTSYWIKILEVICCLKYFISIVLQHYILIGRLSILVTLK